MSMSPGYTRHSILKRPRVFSSLDTRSVFSIAILSVLPGTASAISTEMFAVSRPEIIIPLILMIEIPFAVWVSGFMGSSDRKTMGRNLMKLFSHDFSRMTFTEILGAVFWGENSLVIMIFRIWVAVICGTICIFAFSKLEVVLRTSFDIPIMMIMVMSFSLFSYVFIRNLCEETLRDQIGHGFLSGAFCACLFYAVWYGLTVI